MANIKFDSHGEKKTQIFSTIINFPMEEWPQPSNDSKKTLKQCSNTTA